MSKKLPFGFGHRLTGKEVELMGGITAVTTHEQSAKDLELARESLNKKIKQAEREVENGTNNCCT